MSFTDATARDITDSLETCLSLSRIENGATKGNCSLPSKVLKEVDQEITYA